MSEMIRTGNLASDGWEFHRCADAMPIQRFQVLGERASGTNYLRVLLEKNVAMKHIGHYGWKHGFISFTAVRREDLIVVIYRNPKPWLLSLYRKPWHVAPSDWNVTFAQFLRQTWESFRDMDLWPGEVKGPGAQGVPIQQDRDPMTGRPYANPILLRNAKLHSFLTLPARDCNVAMVRYESLRADPGRFVAKLSAFFDIEYQPELALPKNWLGGMGEKVTGENREAEPAFSEADLAFLHEQIDHEQEARLGYLLDKD